MKPGRNDPCNCGSGNIFKHCCEGRVAPRTPIPPPAEIDPLIALYNARRYAELESRAHFLVGQYPGFGFGWKLLGGALKMQGKEALPAFQKVAELMPNEAEAHSNLGNALQELGQHDAARASHRRAAQLNHNFAEEHNRQGVALLERRQFDDAAASFRRSLRFKPDYARAHNNLGVALQGLEQFEGAETCFRHALQLNPESIQAQNSLGNVLRELGQLDDAVQSCRRALAIKPDYAEAYNNLGNALKELGQIDDALASYRRAIEIKPDYVVAQTNLLFTLNYMSNHAPSYCLGEAHQYGRMVDKKVASRFSVWQCAAQPERLRVGMVSGDLRIHPVGYFLESLLAQLDPARIELIAYPTHHKKDELTARIRPYFSAWKPLIGESDESDARLIHADGVHILLDLSGHTGHSRLPLFAWKPAPVQASWLGYFATTGVTEMDYLLADKVGVPEAQRGEFSETVWYLPDTRLCFTPPAVDLPVAYLPSLKNGYLTFGCYQNLAKVGHEVLTAWGNILTALPDAKLRWQSKQFGDSAVTNQLALRLQQHGIDPARVSLHGAVSRGAYLASHAEVDLILDTFPFPGGTTTCEALWMGVPTLTLAGDTLLARQGASLLTVARLEDWITTSVADYIDKAVKLAGNLPKLAALRAGLREQVSKSPLLDAPRFARNFEEALRGMWQAQTQSNLPIPPERLTASRD